MNKTSSVLRLDSSVIKKAKIDEAGFLRDTPILTRTGVFKYANPDGSMRREYRPPEEVLKPESLATYKGAPITIGHHGFVNSNNAKDLVVGSVLSEGKGEGENVVGDIVIYDLNSLGESRELSLGYLLDVEPAQGIAPNGESYDYIQRNVRINHLAVVKSARAGHQARINMDGNEVVVDEKEKGGKLMKLDGKEFEVSKELEEAITKIQKRADSISELEEEKKELKKKLDTETARADGLSDELKELPTKLEKARMDAIEEVKARAELVEKAKKFNVDAKEEMSNKDVKIAVIKTVRENFDAKDKTDDYINAAFDFATDSMAKQRVVVNSKGAKAGLNEDEESSVSKREAMIKRLNEDYKGESK